MSRRLASVLLAMLVLTAAMGLKTVVAKHTSDRTLVAGGVAPYPKPLPDSPN
jgi:hypothetical protein